MEPGATALKTFGLATAGVIAIEALVRWGIVQWGLAPLAGTGLARLLDIAWLALVLSRCPRGWAQMGLGRKNWRLGLRRGLIWSAGFGLMAALGWAGLHVAGVDPLRLIQPSPGGRLATPALLFLVGGLISPVAEEIYFRGVVYGGLRRWGFWLALILSTLVFSLLHAGAPGLPITQIVGGLVFAVAYEIEKTLLVPITIHVLGNLAIFSLPYLI
jgi:membrane protease YdiL (CAAX protease family)